MKWREKKIPTRTLSILLFTPIRLSSSPAAQILLIFGFMHRRVAARHLLRLKRVSLSRAH